MSFVTHVCKRFIQMTKVVGPIGKTKSYKGAFIVKKHPPRYRNTDHDIEYQLEKMKEVKEMTIAEPSPFHVVYRHVSMKGRSWSEKVLLRRLGLHGKDNVEPVVLPNTPNFNKILWEIKHLIRLRPVKFPDGIPTEKDIGATKLCHYTGVLRINDAFRVSQERLNGDQTPELYTGKYLTGYLRKLSGIFRISH